MRPGIWHQCGDKSQRLVIEQLQHGAGVGVIVSPRDVNYAKSAVYSAIYHDLGAHVLIDPQFYVPDYANDCLGTYPTSPFRMTATRLHQLTLPELGELAQALEAINRTLSTNGLIAPAVTYQAGRPDIIQLNAQLFDVSKQVGDSLGIPTYATVVLGGSITASDHTIAPAMSKATALPSDGWYYGYEFGQERVPSAHDSVFRCCASGLDLVCTGKPVMHAFAGPMSLLSFGFGATGAGVGHNQNLWRFTPGRWGPPTGQGGGGDAPPRFFSPRLWGTIVYQDETALLPQDLRNEVLVQSPFSARTALGLTWDRWSANKHLVYQICSTISEFIQPDPRANARMAITILDHAVDLHGRIAATRLELRDGTNSYQLNWRTALRQLLRERRRDFEYFDLLR